MAGCEGEGSQESQTDPSTTSHFTAPVDNGGLVVSGGSSVAQPEARLWGQESLIPSSSSALPRPANYQAEGIIKRLQDR